MYNKIRTILFDQQHTAIGGSKNVPNGKDWKTPFMEGRSLYLFEPLGHSKKMRDSKFDFAIIPMPKYDENQKEYMTPILQYVHTMYVTVANQKTDVIGATLENMAAEYYRTLRPAYYETVLENKRVRDDESLEMLETIFKNRELNPAVVFDWKITNLLNNAALNGKDTIVSDVEKQSKQIQKAIGLIPLTSTDSNIYAELREGLSFYVFTCFPNKKPTDSGPSYSKTTMCRQPS